MGSVTGFYPSSDDGSTTITINEKVNRVELVITSEGVHTDPASFVDGVQNWSVSLGDLTFEPATELGRATLEWAPLQGTLDKPGYNTDSDAFYTFASDDTASPSI